jgi:Ni2+-binding GTPase involved in maturation of urease and hydrogenase
MKNPLAISVVGPFGSGKTHTLAEIAPELERSGYPTRLIINDLTSSVSDKRTLGELASVASMLTGGCVGCGDSASFVDALRRALEQDMSVVVESPATLHANEIRELIRSVYGERSSFMAMWDLRSHERNIAYHAPLHRHE